MEQRLLRLGEIVDDYCPRERRVTNHAIVALVGDTIQQTRCATCDTEHVYKGGRIPARKKKNDVAALETAVLASVNGTQLVARIDPTQAASARPAEPKPADPAPMAAGAAGNGAQPQAGDAPAANGDDPATTPRTSDEPLAGGWIGHRTLIRASLPRTEGEAPPPRPIPEFTMHQRQTRGSHSFRNGNGWGGGDRQARGGGFRGNGHAGGSGNGNGNEVNGNRANSGGNPFSQHNHGGGFGGNGNPGQGGRPPGQGGKRHRHGKHRRPR
jgi:hypothetical protein